MSQSYWPTAVDYQTALQIPAVSFAHNDLQHATVDTTTWGLPLALTGNMAVVFRLVVDNKKMALRCFTRKQAMEGLEARYVALAKHLKATPALSLPALENFDFQAEGIQVHGEMYPTMGMPWLAGKQLQTFIDRHLDQPTVLRTLAERWRSFMSTLHRHSFAHGDLSDGNILIKEDLTIQLIDFDAAYVPSLASTPPNEIGKPNFQHPGRLSPQSPQYGYYAENVDAFASLMIYVSLHATATDPDMWEAFHDEDNLIFTHKDFLNPGKTPIWEYLHANDNAYLRALTDLLENSLHQTVDQLPDLETALQSLPKPLLVPVSTMPTDQDSGQATERPPAPLQRTEPSVPEVPVSAASRPAGRRKKKVSDVAPTQQSGAVARPAIAESKDRTPVAHQPDTAAKEQGTSVFIGIALSIAGVLTVLVIMFLLTGASLPPAETAAPIDSMEQTESPTAAESAAKQFE